jgi:hypothetical protein
LPFEEWKKRKKREYRIAANGLDKRSFNRRSRKFQKYAKKKQLVGGEFYCKSGRPIDEERLGKYEALCHHMVRRYLPAMALYEAALDYEDLVNRCRFEVFLALLDGFDPEKAMGVKEDDPKIREQRLLEKQADPEMALLKAEKAIVFGRLKNYLRRTRWEYHPTQLGGQTESLDASVVDGINQEMAKNHFSVDVSSETLEDKDSLLEAMDMAGPEGAKERFDLLTEDQRSDLVEHLQEVVSWN